MPICSDRAASAPHLFHEADQRRVGDEGPRPQAFVYLGFVDDTRRFLNQECQEIERLRRQVQRLAVLARDLAPRRIEDEASKLCSHALVM